MPIKIAIGIVAATVDVAQGLCFIAFTTTNPRTAIKITIIKKVPTNEAVPPIIPISSLAI